MKIAYLTIDDGPSPHMREKVEFLDSKDIKAVWFCRGDFLEERPEHALFAIQQGHVIANHSYSHPKFSDISLDQAYQEIDRTDQIIESLYKQSGVLQPYKAFRFPYGDKGDLRYGDLSLPLSADGQERKDAIQMHLQNWGYTQPKFERVLHPYHRAQGIFDDVDWRWTYDVMEWALKKEEPPEGIDSLEKVLKRMEVDVPEQGRELQNPAIEEIILVHDQEHSRGMLGPIIEWYRSHHFEFALP